MAIRYYVAAKEAKWKGKLYAAGDILPAEFTSRDRDLHLFSRRIRPVNVQPGEEEAKRVEELGKLAPEPLNPPPRIRPAESVEPPEIPVKEEPVEPSTDNGSNNPEFSVPPITPTGTGADDSPEQE
jgi:hypothetical protein